LDEDIKRKKLELLDAELNLKDADLRLKNLEIFERCQHLGIKEIFIGQDGTEYHSVSEI
jgi:hypothetical protein